MNATRTQSKTAPTSTSAPSTSAALADPLQADGLADPLQADGLADPLASSMQVVGGPPVPGALQARMESTMGADFSGVRIHADDSSAADIGALAYTRGDDVHFAPGAYSPDTAQGRHTLGHELAHVVQQRAGRVPVTGEVGGMPLNDDPALEGEADRVGSALG